MFDSLLFAAKAVAITAWVILAILAVIDRMPAWLSGIDAGQQSSLPPRALTGIREEWPVGEGEPLDITTKDTLAKFEFTSEGGFKRIKRGR